MGIFNYAAALEEFKQREIAHDLTRLTLVSPEQAVGKSLITLLEEHFLKWEPRDIRLSASFRDKSSLRFGNEDTLSVDIYKYLSIKPVARKPMEGSVEFAIQIPSNLSEIAAYNAAVDRHNDEWIEQGSPHSIFDPSTGDEIKVEGWVDKIYEERRDGARLPSYFKATGKLDWDPPVLERATVGSLEARIRVEGEEFLVEYVCKNSIGEILYFATIQERNLSVIGRKMMHQLFGNPFQTSSEEVENLYGGITMLLRGAKVSHARSNHGMPQWAFGDFKQVDTMAAVDQATVSTFGTLSWFLTYVIPLIALCVGVVFLFKGIMGGLGAEGGSSLWLEAALGVGAGGTLLSWGVGRWLEKGAEKAHLRKNFRF